MNNTPYKYSKQQNDVVSSKYNIPGNEFLAIATCDFKDTLDREILELPMLEQKYIREYPNNSIIKLRQ